MTKKADCTIVLSPGESKMLWQLLNAQGVAAPFADAAAAGVLYAKLREVAIEHGHAKPPADGNESA